jgi:hypothetical protein
VEAVGARNSPPEAFPEIARNSEEQFIWRRALRGFFCRGDGGRKPIPHNPQDLLARPATGRLSMPRRSNLNDGGCRHDTDWDPGGDFFLCIENAEVMVIVADLPRSQG